MNYKNHPGISCTFNRVAELLHVACGGAYPLFAPRLSFQRAPSLPLPASIPDFLQTFRENFQDPMALGAFRPKMAGNADPPPKTQIFSPPLPLVPSLSRHLSLIFFLAPGPHPSSSPVTRSRRSPARARLRCRTRKWRKPILRLVPCPKNMSYKYPATSSSHAPKTPRRNHFYLT